MSRIRFKDYFSSDSVDYRNYRPVYPPELFDYLSQQSPTTNLAWDCATGSGQAACALAQHFSHVVASDASQQQIKNAAPCEHVEYNVMPAEKTLFASASVDLVCVAQALHWFQLDMFFKEVKRVLKPGGVLAVWSYQLLNIEPQINNIINQLYSDTLNEYWPAERRLVESGYEDISFPWPKQATPTFEMQTQWNLPQLLGYLGTWSATRAYIEAGHTNPLIETGEQLQSLWGDVQQTKSVRWPLTLHLFYN